MVDLLQNSKVELNRGKSPCCDVPTFNTGFGCNNELHFEHSCRKPKLKTPLYKDNYLREFATEEEKAAVRKALGLFGYNDVVAMSLLTTSEEIPSTSSLLSAPVKQMRQGDVFFLPITSFKAVYDSSGNTLQTRFDEIQSLLTVQQKELNNITQISQSSEISSLGDVQLFLQGFNNGDTLLSKLDEINQDILRFEKTGEILN